MFKEGQRALVKDWHLELSAGQYRLPRGPKAPGRSVKLVHNIVLSMPAPTPPDKVLAAAKAFARDKAAPSLAPVLTRTAARDDDVLQDVTPPSSSGNHPNHARPSTMELVHAAKVASLPVRNPQGSYAHEPPALATSGQIGEYIQNRTAAWVEHRQRQKHRRAHARPASAVSAPSAPTTSS